MNDKQNKAGPVWEKGVEKHRKDTGSRRESAYAGGVGKGYLYSG